MADYATLGHFLPYLLRRRLASVLWPADGTARTGSLLLLALMMAYGAGFGFMLNSGSTKFVGSLPSLLVALNASLLVSALLVDFVPMLRLVTRPLPEHFPVSARQNVFTAFLLDFITLRRLIMVAALLTTLAVAPRHGLVPGFSLLLLVGATVLSFNLRLLVALRRWRHPLLLLHLGSLALMGWWLAHPKASYYTELGIGMALLPWLLWAAQLYWLAPYFSARYLPAVASAPAGPTPSRLPLEWKVYMRKTWLPLLMGLVVKVGLLGATGLLLMEHSKQASQGYLYLVFMPVLGFTYANNNLFGNLGPLATNEMLRLGLTPRLLWLYARLTGPIVLIDCLLSAALLLALFPRSYWPLLGLLPLGAAALTSLGLWSSLYKAKQVTKAVDFANMRHNASQLMSICTLALAAILYFLPWWWARIALAALVTLSAWWPIRQVLRNDGPLRRQLWHRLNASLN